MNRKNHKGDIHQRQSPQRICVLGAGISGLGAVKLAIKKGYQVFLSEKESLGREERAWLENCKVPFEERGHTSRALKECDAVVVSPSVPASLGLLKEARGLRVEVMSEIEFGFRHLSAKTFIIAVTGTNGKSTTCSMIHHVLKEEGKDVMLAGNIGYGLCGQLAERAPKFLVLELSSFQLDGISRFRANISAILNITPDHLNAYGGNFDAYIESKLRITANQTPSDHFLYWQQDPAINRGLQENVEAIRMPVTLLATAGSGASIQGDTLRLVEQSREEDITLPSAAASGQGQMLNYLFTALACWLAGIDLRSTRSHLENFPALPHRMQGVMECDGLKYVNDSKATNVAAALSSLASVEKPVIWIAGGEDKGNDYSLLDSCLDGIRALIVLGEAGQKIETWFQGKISDIRRASSMRVAVEIAHSMQLETGTVLLSPACASFDQFKDYRERGVEFVKSVVDVLMAKRWRLNRDKKRLATLEMSPKGPGMERRNGAQGPGKVKAAVGATVGTQTALPSGKTSGLDKGKTRKIPVQKRK